MLVGTLRISMLDISNDRATRRWSSQRFDNAVVLVRNKHLVQAFASHKSNNNRITAGAMYRRREILIYLLCLTKITITMATVKKSMSLWEKGHSYVVNGRRIWIWLVVHHSWLVERYFSGTPWRRVMSLRDIVVLPGGYIFIVGAVIIIFSTTTRRKGNGRPIIWKVVVKHTGRYISLKTILDIPEALPTLGGYEQTSLWCRLTTSKALRGFSGSSQQRCSGDICLWFTGIILWVHRRRRALFFMRLQATSRKALPSLGGQNEPSTRTGITTTRACSRNFTCRSWFTNYGWSSFRRFLSALNSFGVTFFF